MLFSQQPHDNNQVMENCVAQHKQRVAGGAGLNSNLLVIIPFCSC